MLGGLYICGEDLIVAALGEDESDEGF